MYACIHITSQTFIPVHVAHLPLLSSLFTLGLCIPKGSLQYLPIVVY